MIENPKHQFAAVMFADIVGYTALMQNNEEQALIQLKNFKSILETKVAANKGQIIQFYGDGCLVVFEEATAALNCATVLQKAFRGKAAVPVRIGLDEGEVVFRDNNVFGHTVNIASRVEAMGIAGAVLMSSKFRGSIKDNPAFKLKWLGKFNLKNVKDPMSLYALANEGLPIPTQSELKAATSKTQNSFMQKIPNYLYWLVPSLIAIGLGGLLWRAYQSPKIDAQTLKKRIAVLPFTNNTNDPSLAVFGNMAADWISTGLMGVADAEVVSPFTVRTHQAAIGILENDAQNRPSFAELTGAKNLITGVYYEDNGNIVCKLELVDALDGQLRFSFKEIKGKANQKEILLTKLREQVTGYWAAKDLVDANKISPPKAEAYALYLDFLQKRGTEEELAKILALDSTFHLPRIHFINIITGSQVGGTKEHLEFLDRHFDELSAYEKAWFTYLKGLYSGEPMVSFKSLNTIRQKYPKDFLLNHSTAAVALNGLNNPTLALTIYDELPLDQGQAKGAGIYWNERFLNMVTAYIELDKLQEADNLLANTIPNPDIDNNTSIKTRSLEGLTSKNQEKTGQAYQQLLATASTKPFSFFWVSVELMQSNLLPDDFRAQQERDLVEAYQQLAPKNPNRLFWRNFIALAAKDETLLKLKNLDKLGKGLEIGNLAAIGQLYINNNELAKVQPIIDALKAQTTCNYIGQISTSCAAAYYYIGQLKAQIGETEAAINNLQKAKDLGLGNELHRFHFSRYLTVLYDLPAFQQIIQPIWPNANDGEIIVKEVNQYHGTSDDLEDVTANFQEEGKIQLANYNQFYNLKLGTTNNYNNQIINYQYQLTSIDQAWNDAEKGELTIGNLPYGEQALRIKARFPNGAYSKKILEIPISVPKPFYLNIWLVAAMLILLFAGVYLGADLVIPKQKMG